jgi:methylmalonyl-CoA/ethylmalonyl-CoA epimerase
VNLKIDLPPISQIVIVVNDPHKMVGQYSSIFGLGPWDVYEFVPEKHWIVENSLEKLSPVSFLMAKAMLHNIELCFMKPLEGKSLHKEFLESSGEGLFNLVFNVSDYEKTFNEFVKAGFKPLEWVDTFVPTYKGNMKACYFDTRSIGGLFTEIRWGSWMKNPKP